MRNAKMGDTTDEIHAHLKRLNAVSSMTAQSRSRAPDAAGRLALSHWIKAVLRTLPTAGRGEAVALLVLALHEPCVS
jgi:hypothetical protein